MDHFLISCCANNYFPLVDIYLQCKPELCKNILHQACWWNQLPIVYSILTNPPSKNIVNDTLDCSQITPLSLWLLRYSKECGSSTMFSPISDFLLIHGADPNIRDSLGNSSLHYACAFDFGPVYARSDNDGRKQPNKNGWTPKDCAVARMDKYVFSEVYAKNIPEFYSDASDLGLHTTESLKISNVRPFKPSINTCRQQWMDLMPKNPMSDLFWMVLDSNPYTLKTLANDSPEFIEEFTKYTHGYSCLQVACIKNDKRVLDIIKTAVFHDSLPVKSMSFESVHFALMFGDELLIRTLIQYGGYFDRYYDELKLITKYLNRTNVTNCFNIIKQSIKNRNKLCEAVMKMKSFIICTQIRKYPLILLEDEDEYEYIKETQEYKNTFVLLLCGTYPHWNIELQ